MINGSDLRDFYIGLWRKIPALVVAMGDDESKIRKHQAAAGISKSLEREVLEMPTPSIFVAYEGFTVGNSRLNEVTKHVIRAFIRAATNDDDASITYGALMIDGVPDGEELSVRHLAMSIDVDPMDPPRYRRASGAELTFDLWELTFTVPETGG